MSMVGMAELPEVGHGEFSGDIVVLIGLRGRK